MSLAHLAPPEPSSGTRPAPRLSFVFPAFDEEGNIEVLLDAVMTLAPKLEPDFEVVVVDDGSRDRTAELVERRRSERLRLVRHPSNRVF